MDEIQTTPEVNELQAQCAWLRKQVQIILILLILVSTTLTLFLWRQVKYTTADLNGVRPMIEEYDTKQKPAMDEFIKKLVDYGRKNPDFAAIYNKYGLSQVSQMAASNAVPKK